MKVYDEVKLIVDKNQYNEYGVNKGMVGWICDDRKFKGDWLVTFFQNDSNEIICIAVKEEDLEPVQKIHGGLSFDTILEKQKSFNQAEKTEYSKTFFQEYNLIKLMVDRERYLKDCVHAGMIGWICDPRKINECWLVSFNGYYDEIACISVKEDDMKIINKSHKNL